MKGDPDAFLNSAMGINRIDQSYVDRISITHGEPILTSISEHLQQLIIAMEHTAAVASIVTYLGLINRFFLVSWTTITSVIL